MCHVCDIFYSLCWRVRHVLWLIVCVSLFLFLPCLALPACPACLPVSLSVRWLTDAVDITNGQLTPNNNTPLLTQALSGMRKITPFTFLSRNCGKKIWKITFQVTLRRIWWNLKKKVVFGFCNHNCVDQTTWNFVTQCALERFHGN